MPRADIQDVIHSVEHMRGVEQTVTTTRFRPVHRTEGVSTYQGS